MPPLRLVERHRFLDSYGFVLVLIVTTYVTRRNAHPALGRHDRARRADRRGDSDAPRLARREDSCGSWPSWRSSFPESRRVANLVDPTDDSLLPVLFACSTLLYVVAPFSIVRHVARRQRIDVETFLGALAAYLLLGIAFAFSYRFIGEVQDTPFFGDAGDGTIADVLFFSFITLTTTGYGNLVPAENPGQSLAVLEALLGQLFLVTAVAKIVSAWQPRRREATTSTDE